MNDDYVCSNCGKTFTPDVDGEPVACPCDAALRDDGAFGILMPLRIK